MSEQELYMMSEEKAKDEQSAVSMLKKHQILEQAVEDYAETVHQLSKTSRALVADSHPESERISMRQSKVDKLYAGLKDLAEERRGKLDERHRLFQLNREVDDLEQWIAEREVVAGSHELGQDYEHVTMLQERFREFAETRETSGRSAWTLSITWQMSSSTPDIQMLPPLPSGRTGSTKPGQTS